MFNQAITRHPGLVPGTHGAENADVIFEHDSAQRTTSDAGASREIGPGHEARDDT
jgi:hypothetical protein